MGVIKLRYLYVCNTSSDNISKVDLAVFKEKCKIPFNLCKAGSVGPHGICAYKDNLLIANSYDNSLSIIDTKQDKEIENYFIGMHCNGVKVCGENAYVVCGELNSIIVFNLKKKKIVEEIPCESFPHSISICKDKNIMVVSNMHSDSITLADCSDNGSIINIKVSTYPTKAVFTPSGKYILVCESNIGLKENGTLRIIETETLKTLKRIKLGNAPVDVYAEDNYCYVSNFGDGSVSIVDIINRAEVKKIKIGGMPRGIIKNGGKIYIGDNYNNLLIELDIKKENKKVISIGGEPTGMTLI